MALVLIENKRLQSSVNDLDASLTRAGHREEDLEMRVLDLEKEHQVLETENCSLMEGLSHDADQ